MRDVDIEQAQMAGLNIKKLGGMESIIRKWPLKKILLSEIRIGAYADRLSPAEGENIPEGILDGRFKKWYGVITIERVVRNLGIDKVENARRIAVRAASRMVDEQEDSIRKEAEEEFRKTQR